VLQKFDPTRFALRADQPAGTQAVAGLEPMIPLSRVAELFAADPVARELALKALDAEPPPPPATERQPSVQP
jgi:hypothetical protein